MSTNAERPQGSGMYRLEEHLDNFVARKSTRCACHDELRGHRYQKNTRRSRLQSVQAHVDDTEERAF
jgi:hypothetical protein